MEEICLLLLPSPSKGSNISEEEEHLTQLGLLETLLDSQKII